MPRLFLSRNSEGGRGRAGELQTARTKFLDGVLGTKEGAALLPEGVERKQLQGDSSRLLAMGPSGSGEQMRQEG